MAITATHHTTDIDDSNLTVYTTASRTPTANRLQLIDVQLSDTNPVLEPTITGCGLTWVAVGTGVEYDTAGTRHAIFRFRALGASPTTGALTITATEAMSGCGWSWAEYDGIDTGGTNGSAAIVQTVTNSGTGTTLSATLAAFGSTNNGVAAGFSTDADSVYTAGSGYTILGQDVSASASPPASIGQEWRANNDTTPDATIAVSATWGIIASEVKAAAAVAPTYPLGAPMYRVAFAFGIPPGTVPAGGDWVYVERRIKSIEIVRGRNRETETVQPARCRIKLDDPSRDLEPNFVASPYYPDVVPMTPVKVECVFTTTGGSSTTYPRFVGYVDDFMPAWNDAAEVIVPCTDAFAALQVVQLRNPYVAEVLKDHPFMYYRFSETATSQPVGDSSGNGRNGTYALTVSFGLQDPITDDHDGAIGLTGGTGWVVAPVGPQTTSRTYEIWFKAADVADAVLAGGYIPPFGIPWEMSRTAAGEVGARVFRNPTLTVLTSSPGLYAINEWHHLALTLDGVNARLYLDGTIEAGPSAFAGAPDTESFTLLGIREGGTYPHNGDLDEFASYSTRLLEARLDAHYDARTAWLGQLTGTRAATVLAAAEWGWGTDLDAGLSTLQSAGDLDGTTALEHILDVTGRGGEGGLFFIDRTGQAVFHDRHWPILNATVAGVFGDAAGELRFVSVEPESSNATIRNDWRGRRDGGPPQVASDQTSIDRYMRRTEPATGEINFVLASDSEVASRLQLYLSQYKDPLFTVRRMVVQQSDANTIVPACLALDLESRVTVRRRPRGGTLAQQDHLVQGWTESWGTETETRWKMTFQLSPIGTEAFWVLGTSTLGVSTRLAV